MGDDEYIKLLGMCIQRVDLELNLLLLAPNSPNKARAQALLESKRERFVARLSEALCQAGRWPDGLIMCKKGGMRLIHNLPEGAAT